MRIVYLHQYFVPPDGSGGTRSYEQARRLVQAGHDVDLITSSAFFPRHYGFRRRVEQRMLDGIVLTVLNVDYDNTMSYARRMRAFAAFALGSTVAARGVRDVDVVFATSTPLTIAIPAVAAKRRFRCPMVFEVRDLWPQLPIAIGALSNPVLIRAARTLESWAYRHADRVIALSPGMKDGVVRTGYPAARVSIIPNACDLDRFGHARPDPSSFLERHPYLKGGMVVTYAGTLGRINGVAYLVEIAREMLTLDPAVRFLVAGAGHELEQVRERARECGVLERNLWMIPPVPKEAMPQLLAATTVATSLFVDLPEMWANSANKFFDALAAGRPVMINYGGWQAELLETSGAGIVVPPGDAVTASRKLHALLVDRDRLRRAGTAAGRLARERFSRDALADRLRLELEAVAGGARG